jgi:cellulose 1,4-beta-cellobiosidase
LPIDGGTPKVDLSFKLVNGSTQAIQLSTIIARYYFTNEIAAPMAVIQYGDVCCPDKVITTHVTATLHSVTPPLPGADTYIEFAFDATTGTLAPAHTVEVEVELSNAVGSVSNQSNDYSYIATATGTQALWDNCPTTGNCTPFHSCVMTVYDGSTLIWGTPPK